MTSPRHDAAPALLLRVIADPSTLPRLGPAQWEPLLSCARRNAVLAYVAERAVAAGVIERLPEVPSQHLLSARTSAARQSQLARWELDRVRRVLQPAGIPLVALKGIAYLLRGMPHAKTRLLSDIDVMVPRDRLDAAERLLLSAGWQSTIDDPYDQHYYRAWSHELPPLLFPGRLLGVDVHHAISPPVSRWRADSEQFWADSVTIGDGAVRVLSPVDTVLHAAVHLFADPEFDGRFRDLLDLDALLKMFGTDDGFWSALAARARAQGLGRPLYYAVEVLRRVLSTPLPSWVEREVRALGPPAVVGRSMNRTLTTVLAPIDPEPWPAPHRGLRWLLYVRSHWLRMPAHLLVPHLVRKSALRGRRGREEAPG